MNTQAKRILEAVCEHFGMSMRELLSFDRHKSVTFARHIGMYLLRSILDMSYPEIGKVFNRDHTTVMSAFRRVSNAPRAPLHLKAIVEALDVPKEAA